MGKEKYEKMKSRIPEDVREHHKKAREEMREGFRSLFPEEFIARRKAARKEMLLAARGMIEHAINRLEKEKE
ncbi:MAG: hypothetical protein JW757_02525 [Anaerolineales bacterium]|nr:hypothetical protein [Anaerolineales bacterium]